MPEEAQLRMANMLKKSHSQDGIRLRSRLGKSTKGDWKKPKRGVKREEWKVRQDSSTTKPKVKEWGVSME